MTSHSYPVEVQSDFIEKITQAKPIPALSEFIWNSLDADASAVEVFLEENELGVLSRIIVRDNGIGIERQRAPDLFRNLGGSWKRSRSTTDNGRMLHGQDGRGRFKAFSLGRLAEWNVAYEKGGVLYSYMITMDDAKLKEVLITDESVAEQGKRRGVTLAITELHKDFRSLTSETAVQAFTEIFALYLTDYKNVSVSINGSRFDPSGLIASQASIGLTDIVEDGKTYPVRLEIIEWRSTTNRSLYLCTEKGFPLLELERRFHIGSFQFSAYMRTAYTAKLQHDGTVELAEMNPKIKAAANESQQAIKDHFRNRAAQEARTVVNEWKEEQIYPYDGEAKTRVEEVERQVFDIVAVNIAQHLPDFSTTQPKSKAMHLRLLRQAIEKSPEDLQLILENVLNLPKRKQEELAELLRDVSLSAIISAAKVVADRLRFLTGLDAILFGAESKKRLKERSQLHRIIAENCWLFGEEYNLSVDDQSLTEVLRKHRHLLGDDTKIDEPVKHISKERGIVDLMLSRAIRRHRVDELSHLVVELKAPRVKIDTKEITQTEGYAIAVMNDERFRAVNTTWTFWVISDDYGEYAKHRMKSFNGSGGKVHEAYNVSIWVKTWAQVLEENRSRMQFFQERLEYAADKGESLKHLKEHYSKFLEGVLVEDEGDTVTEDENTLTS